jgi:hypothetical protein
MANTIKTLSAGDITRKALSILHNNLVFCKTINREYDDRFARSGAKNGGTLLIRNPNQFTIRSGAIMDTQDVTEDTQTLTIATQRGVDINFSSVELTLSLDDFADRILEPAMARLAAEVDKTVIAACYPPVYNHTHTTFGTAPVLGDVLLARNKLAKGLAPTSDRIIMCDAAAANSIITSGVALFNPTTEISRQYDRGVVGQVYGFKFYESEMTPTHTNGSRTDTTPQISTTVGITSGDATMTMDVFASGTTYAAGDVFTIAGVFAVNPETKAVYPHLQQFAVTALATATTTTMVCEVSPVPVTSGAKQNCSIVTASASAVVVNLTAGGSGAASTGYINSLAYHRDAFTMVTADLEMPRGVDFAAREVYDGISLRVVRNYDITNDKFPCRLDVLFGQLTTRPEWACRISS